MEETDSKNWPSASATSGFARLVEVDLREAWQHEARDFTPWMLRNLNALSEAIGIPLEAVDSEVSVESFSADIMARNPDDGTGVLIENQLECSDHTHLGQILTYLAGLEAKTVIWVASEFREPHLSAIRWLNESTIDEFYFFAVRVKVVRIENSPFAPVFDILERPNNWERQLHTVAGRSTQRSEAGTRYAAFWSALLKRYPQEAESGRYGDSLSFRWREMPSRRLAISMYLGQGRVGISVRGPTGEPFEETYNRLFPYREQLEQQLNAPLGQGAKGAFFHRKELGDPYDTSDRDRLVEWLHNTANRYQSALEAVCPAID